MSLLNNAVVPIAVVGLYGLAFVLGVGHYSQEQTAAHLRQIEQHRAEAKAVRRSEETTRVQALNARVAAERAQQAQLAAAMKKAAQAAALAVLPGDPVKAEIDLYALCYLSRDASRRQARIQCAASSWTGTVVCPKPTLKVQRRRTGSASARYIRYAFGDGGFIDI